MSTNEGKSPVTPPRGSSSRGNSSPRGRGSPQTGGSSSRGNSSPRGRGSPPTGGSSSRGNSSPSGRGSPLAPQRPMGVPGYSAFTRYTSPASASSGSGFLQPAQAVVHVGGSSSAAATGLHLGENSPAVRKRNREGGNPPAVAAALNPVRCSVCGREFLTPKALFGHMRSHPERGWKGAHPPPTFRAEEEFADLRVENAPPPEGRAEDDEEGRNYKVPDLNNPPPPDPEN